jgi:hypothetical protein
MALAWYMLKILFPDDPKLRVMGLFGCTHKTVAIGVPLINAIYDGNPAIGLYTLPLLIWHPMQLIIGTFLTPRLKQFVHREEMRLRDETVEESLHVDVVEESLRVDVVEEGRDVTKTLMVGRKRILGRSGSLLMDF